MISKLLKNIFKYLKSINLFIVVILGILFIASINFIYQNKRRSVVIYLNVNLVSSREIDSSRYNYVPYWIGNNINKGDKEKTILGIVTAEVLEKETYRSIGYLTNVLLKLKLYVSKDKSGVYLFKNRPVLVGDLLELNLGNTKTIVHIISLSETNLKEKYEKLRVRLRGEQVESWIVDNINIGDMINKENGEKIAEVISKTTKKSIPIGMTYDNRLGRFIYSSSEDRKDVDLEVELVAQRIGSDYYFATRQRIIVNELLFLSFEKVNINFPIISFTKD
jgi:hypothetical protein